MAPVLIGVIVALTPIDVLRVHSVLFVHPTEVREMRVVKCVSVLNRSGVDESQVDIIQDAINLFFCQHHADDIHGQFASWEEGYAAPKNFWRLADFHWNWQRLAVEEYGLPEFGQCNIVRWSLAIILPYKNKMLIFNVVKVIDTSRYEPNISAQLSLFRVADDPSLISSSEKSQSGEEDGEYFKPRAVSFAGAVSLIWGLWLGISGSWRRRWLLSAGLVAVGWFSQVNYPIINYLW